MDWTLEVVVLPVSDITARLCSITTRSTSTWITTLERAHQRRAADLAWFRLFDRVRRSAMAKPNGAWFAEGSSTRRFRRGSSTEDLLDRGVEASELSVITEADGGHVLRLSRPRRQLMGGAGDQGSAGKPLIPKTTSASASGLAVEVEEFSALFERPERSAFRVEARDRYDVDHEGEEFAAFLEGKNSRPRAADSDPWLALVGAGRARRRVIERVGS